MTNNINGIDVSECYADKKMMKDGLYCFWEGGSCADNKFCYFKECKRLQEENEGLKSLNDFNVQKIEVLQEENEELKAENEQLKKPCLVMPKVKQLAVPIEKYEKLYKVLEEIREIAKYSVMHNSELNANYQIILQKIDEVLNGKD